MLLAQVGCTWAHIARQDGMQDDIRLRDQLDCHLWQWTPSRERADPVADQAVLGLQQIEQYFSRMEAREQQHEQQRLQNEDKKAVAAQDAAEYEERRQAEEHAREAERQARSDERAVLRAEQAARAKEEARNPDQKAKEIAAAAYRAAQRGHVLSLHPNVLPAQPQPNDPESAVMYARALQALFQEQSAASPHLHPDLIEQAIDVALQEQIFAQGANSTNSKVLPQEVRRLAALCKKLDYY